MRKSASKMTRSSLFLLVLSSSSSLWTVSAYPNGAGGCKGGMPAVTGGHLTAGPTAHSGALLESPQGLEVTLNGVPLGDKPASFVTGEPQTLQLTSSTGGYKGFLLRLSGVDQATGANALDVSNSFLNFTDNALNNGNVQHAVKCEDQAGGFVDGITHTNNQLKYLVTTQVIVHDLALLTLDVTVVMQNTAISSEFYYSSFLLNAVQRANPGAPIAAVPTTPFPTRTPSKAPTATPSTAPTMAPTIVKVVDLSTPSSQQSPSSVDNGNEKIPMESVLGEEQLKFSTSATTASNVVFGLWTTTIAMMVLGAVVALVAW